MAEAPSGFFHEEHTADLAIRATGPSLEAAFAEAARGLFAHIVDLGRVEPRVASDLSFHATDIERLLYNFLEGVRFASEVDGVVFSRFEVSISEDVDGAGLRVRAWGEPYAEDRHGHYHEVKAITMHALRVTRAPPEVYVVLDI